eukprot:TRINITY_DN15914_c0_g1_i10.p2 TRINITY_DN15914_c0_g1~~TRINITY_DN15914_c0_g1_i10.p2  ORF type:complete len:137 (+),score=36.84 TRINITY_DN15914_c0_g1_i10:225-635(+)
MFMNKKVKIGGDERDGKSQWEGYAEQAGWELKFKVDCEGNISGDCDNDNNGGADEKEFSGVWEAEDQDAGEIKEIRATFTGGASTGNVNTYAGTIDLEAMTFEGTLACVEGSFAGHTGTISGGVEIEDWCDDCCED